MKFAILADAGGTSTKWQVTNLSEHLDLQFQTEGMSPLYLTESEIYTNLCFAFPDEAFRLQCERVEYYGAGCALDQAPDRMNNALQKAFPYAAITVDSDMMGAAHLLWGTEQGLVGILGTGSNAGFYNGHSISYARPSLGYLLGDEGSGAWLGRLLLRDWLYGTLPQHLAADMDEQYAANLGLVRNQQFFLSTEPVMIQLFQGEHPNRFLAQFAHFLHVHIDDVYCKNLVANGLEAYITTLLLPNATNDERRVKMVGGIANAFRTQLDDACKKYDLELVEIRVSALPA